MLLQQYLLLFFLIMMALAFPYYLRANQKTRLRKCNENQDIEGALKILNGRTYSYLFGKYAVLWNKAQLYMACNDIDNLSQTINEILYGKFSKKEKTKAIHTTFFFFVDAENKEMCETCLRYLKDNADIQEYEFDQAMYHTLVTKNSTNADVDIIKVRLNQLKQANGNHNAQIGIMEYMLGMHYTNVNNQKEAQYYLRHAKTNLKGTPYRSKVKDML